MKKQTTPKRYKVILTLWKDKSGTEKNRLSHEEQKDLILKLIAKYPDTYNYNQNRNQDAHYPIYYNERFYFGQPIVLTAVTEKELTEMLEFFKEGGLCWWVTYLYECYSFEQLGHNNIQMLNYNDRNKYLFVSIDNLVNEYKDGRGVIQDETTIKGIIGATK